MTNVCSWSRCRAPLNILTRALFLLSCAGHRHEGDGQERGALIARVGAVDEQQALGKLLAHEKDEPPADGELIQQPLRDVVGRPLIFR